MPTGQNQLKDPQFHVSYCVKQGVIKVYKDRIVPSGPSGRIALETEWTGKSWSQERLADASEPFE